VYSFLDKETTVLGFILFPDLMVDMEVLRITEELLNYHTIQTSEFHILNGLL
jgi:hypothetical protein